MEKWTCKECGGTNGDFRSECRECGSARPDEDGIPNLKALLAKMFTVFFTFVLLAGGGCLFFVFSTQREATRNPLRRDGIVEMAMQRPGVLAVIGATILVLSFLVAIAAHSNDKEGAESDDD